MQEFLYSPQAAHQFQCKNPTGESDMSNRQILLTFQYFAPPFTAFLLILMGCQKSILPEKAEAIIFYESVK
jgi:hypothetical protein